MSKHMTAHEKEMEWERLNRMGADGCNGATMLRLAHMDKLAKELGFPMSKDIYMTERAALGVSK